MWPIIIGGLLGLLAYPLQALLAGTPTSRARTRLAADFDLLAKIPDNFPGRDDLADALTKRVGEYTRRLTGAQVIPLDALPPEERAIARQERAQERSSRRARLLRVGGSMVVTLGAGIAVIAVNLGAPGGHGFAYSGRLLALSAITVASTIIVGMLTTRSGP